MAETSAEQYTRLKIERFTKWVETTFTDEALKGVQLFETTCPNGMKFKYRPLNAQYAVAGGMIPLVLSAQVAQAVGGGLTEEHKPTGDEVLANMRANAQMACYCCVEPRLVIGSVGARTNAVSLSDITFEDLGHLVNAIMGGDGADSLKTFRKRKR